MTAMTLPISATTGSPTTRGKVRVGPAVSVIFEDRQTLWLRMQESMRFARKSGVAIDRQLDWYRRLMPEAGRWPAAVWIGRPGSRITPDLSALRTAIAQGHFELTSRSGHSLAAKHLPHRHTDRLIGFIGWIEFLYEPALETELTDPNLGWQLRIDADNYHHESDVFYRTRDGIVTCG